MSFYLSDNFQHRIKSRITAYAQGNLVGGQHRPQKRDTEARQLQRRTLEGIQIEGIDLVSLEELVSQQSVLDGHAAVRRGKLTDEKDLTAQRSTFES